MTLRTSLWLTTTALMLFAGPGCTATLPAAAQSTIDTHFPDAAIHKCEAEYGNLYEVELTAGQQQHEVLVSKDGTLVEVETTIDESELPATVATTAKRMAGQHPLTELEKVEQLARKTPGGIEPLDEPLIFYEIEWKVWGIEQEIKVNPDGSVRRR